MNYPLKKSARYSHKSELLRYLELYTKTEVTTMAEIKFDIIETIAILSEGNKGWKKELNLISWNGRDSVYDIRDWFEDHKKMGKGTTLTISELQMLKNTLLNIAELD